MGVTCGNPAKAAKAGADVLVVVNPLQIPGYERTLLETTAAIKRGGRTRSSTM